VTGERKRWRIAALLVAVVALSGCAPGTPVVVINHSPVPLTDVVVTGSGFSQTVGTIPAGQAETVHVRPRGETGLRITFEANGKRYSSGRDALEEDHLERAEITVGLDYSIHIDFNPQ
jgi:hypothetical protein